MFPCLPNAVDIVVVLLVASIGPLASDNVRIAVFFLKTDSPMQVP